MYHECAAVAMLACQLLATETRYNRSTVTPISVNADAHTAGGGHVLRGLLATSLAVVLTVGAIAPAEATSAGVDDGCYTDYPYRLDIENDTGDVTACANAKNEYVLRNDGDEVWAFTTRSLIGFEILDQSARSELYHASAGSFYPYAFMAPGDVVAVPWDATDVQWSVHPDLALLWTFWGKVADRVEEEAGQFVEHVVAGKSARRAALWKCSVALWSAARNFDETVTLTADAEDVWDYAATRVAEAGSCATAWEKARGTTADVPFPRYSRVVTRMATSAAVAADVALEIRGTQDVLRSLGRALICSLPRVNC